MVQVTAANSTDKAMTVRCAGGKVATGGGARVLGAIGSADAEIPAGVAIVASYPSGLTGEKSPSWTGVAKEVGAVTDSWRLSVHVICAIASD